MTASYWTQLKLSFWKSFVVRKRKPFLWAAEILWPVAILLVVCLLHITLTPSYVKTCQFRARAMPSAGVVPFVQSGICNVRNPCRDLENYEDIPTYPGSQ